MTIIVYNNVYICEICQKRRGQLFSLFTQGFVFMHVYAHTFTLKTGAENMPICLLLVIISQKIYNKASRYVWWCISLSQTLGRHKQS